MPKSTQSASKPNGRVAGRGPRLVALVGPQGVGKTTLMKALVARAEDRPIAALGDASPEAREFGMTTEMNMARCAFLGEPWTILDCPGHIELFQESINAMRAADLVVVVGDANPDRAAALSLYLRYLDERAIPHALFINKMDQCATAMRELLEALQIASDRPLVLRQAPIRDGERIVGAVDLASERAWRYQEGQPSQLIDIPAEMIPRETEAREHLLETLADFDDALMEQILEDRIPPSAEIYAQLARDIEKDLIAPVFIGAAAHGNGLTRLWKFLRHETPDVALAAARLTSRAWGGDGGVEAGEAACVLNVIKVHHAPHTGKTAFARVLSGVQQDGCELAGGRLSGLMALNGEGPAKAKGVVAGEVAVLPRQDALGAGDLLVDGALARRGADFLHVLPPLYGLVVRPCNEKDDVKLTASLAKLADEDVSLRMERNDDAGGLLLRGQGDVHLRLAAFRLKERFNTPIETTRPKAAYRETIKVPIDQHARHKKQSGGHGQFADIKVKIEPLSRGEGFVFGEKIHGGSVPKQFIPAVEQGVREGLNHGPLGFPVIDVGVTLYDGQAHSVDSNELSFNLAGRSAMKEALPKAKPVLLEPMHAVTIHIPSDHTSKALALVTGRRGQIQGIDARNGWAGWDQVNAVLPESALSDLIIELRSLSQGVAAFTSGFDHYEELHGREAEDVVAQFAR